MSEACFPGFGQYKTKAKRNGPTTDPSQKKRSTIMNTLNTSKERELSVTPQSLGSRAARRPYRLLLAAAAVLAVTALGTSTAQAGVEFVTRIGDCGVKVDQIGDGKDLFIIAGNNIRFEVWGNSVDLSNPSTGFRIGVDSGAGTVKARIIRQRSGATNQGRGCGNTGSAEVEVDSPVTLTSNIQRSLFFKMPFGDESRLQMTIKAYPTFNVTWESTSDAVSCIVKTGTFEKLNQDHKIRIQLPPGHRQDQTSCTQNTLIARGIPSDIGELDIAKEFTYLIAGLPAFLQASPPSVVSPKVFPQISFTISVSGIRALTTVSNSNIVISSLNPNRSSTLNLEVRPDLGNGFSAAATCNPASLNVGDPTDCRLTLASPVTNPQPITWRITTATCFTQAVAEAPYDANAPFQVFSFPAGQSAANIRVRSVNNSGCTSSLSPIRHVFEAWIGDFRTDPQVTTVTSGPKYTRTTISLVRP